MSPEHHAGATPAGDTRALAARLAVVRRRLALDASLRAACYGSVTLTAVVAATWTVARIAPGRATLVRSLLALAVAAGAAAAFASFRRRRTGTGLAAAAACIERHAPSARNVVITAADVVAGRVAVSPRVAPHLVSLAVTIAEGVSVNAIVPAARLAGLACVTVVSVASSALIAATLVRAPAPGAGSPPVGAQAAPLAARGLALDVRIVPPAYTRRAPEVRRDPRRLDVLEDSTIELRDVAGGALAARFNGHAVTGATGVDRTLGLVARESGSLVVDLGALARRTIALTVTPDPPPVVRVTAPGRDLVVDAATSSLDLLLSAIDDQQVSSLRVRYTKVSGSGEQFEFVEGDLPVSVRANTPTAWSGRSRLDLASLALKPGDLIAYRAVARDGRPSGGEGSSDTYVVRVAQPGDVASAGFAIDEDENKFALSQQMLLVKTERLHGDRGRLAREAFEGRAAALAVEQRMIRNEFSFMVGGEVEDEEEEAAHSHELQEGRDDNQGRRDVLRAIRAMSRAEQMLNRASTAEALPHERDAVEALQRAFSRTRYLLRTLPVRARIDLERRLGGDREGSRSSRRTPPPVAPRDRVVATLGVIGRLEVLAGGMAGGGIPPSTTVEIAEALLALDPRSTTIAEAAQLVLDAAGGDDDRGRDAHRAALARATRILVDDVRAHLAAPVGPSSAPDMAAIRGGAAGPTPGRAAQRAGGGR